MKEQNSSSLKKTIGTWEVMVAGVAIVVAASTLVSDFTGYFTMGAAFVMALLLAFVINLLLGLSAANLGVSFPKAGALYEYAQKLLKGRTGKFVGTVLAFSFVGMFGFAASGETAAGAFGLQALFYSDTGIEYFIIVCSVLAIIPNILGIKATAWVSAALLLFMLGIRWFFGIAGFLGISSLGSWSYSNLSSGVNFFDLFGETGILTAGLALAFWSFVGIEFACSLAEEVKDPKKSLPKGIVLGLVGILLTSLVMGIGVTGTAPLEFWQEASTGNLGRGGEAPQLAVGSLMFGEAGYILMALASFTATLGTLTIAFAVMPRIIYSVARDGNGLISKFLGKLHPKFGTPVNAILIIFVLYIVPAIYSSQVIIWLYSATYAWIILYIMFHALSLINMKNNLFSLKALVPVIGILLTLVSLYYAFKGEHLIFGSRALLVFLAALIAASSFHLIKYFKRIYRSVSYSKEIVVETNED
jgi:amino acid transporter